MIRAKNSSITDEYKVTKTPSIKLPIAQGK